MKKREQGQVLPGDFFSVAEFPDGCGHALVLTLFFCFHHATMIARLAILAERELKRQEVAQLVREEMLAKYEAIELVSVVESFQKAMIDDVTPNFV